MAVLKSYFGRDLFSSLGDVEYPILSGGRFEEILKFRDDEWPHLDEFRNSIEDGIRSGVDISREMSNSTIKIEKAIGKRQRAINKKLINEGAVTLVGAAVTAATSTVSGFGAIALAALSGGHFVRSTLPALLDKFRSAEEARDDQYYYAWKVRQRLRR